MGTDRGLTADRRDTPELILQSVRARRGRKTFLLTMAAFRSPVIRAIILGAPASGKGTISSRIVRDFKMKHLSGGDLLRSQISAKTDLGLRAKQFVDAGSLVPDDVMSTLIVHELKLMKEDSWLLDGFPRTLNKVKYLTAEHDVTVQRVQGRLTHLPSGRVYNTDFNPPKVAGIDDVTGEPLIQREDDKPEAVRQRLQSYHSNILPILDFFDKRGKLQQFKGRFTNEIWPSVEQFLSKLTASKI